MNKMEWFALGFLACFVLTILQRRLAAWHLRWRLRNEFDHFEAAFQSMSFDFVRPHRQAEIAQAVRSTFGEDSLNDRGERALRLLEESIELAQAEAMPRVKAHTLLDRVYDKPVGDPVQEGGGVCLTLHAWATSAGLDIDHVELKELRRLQTGDQAHFRRKHAEKVRLGLGLEP